MFFFQAEDGIRDVAVTGVQTCALPISTFCMKPEIGPSALVPKKLASVAGKSRRLDAKIGGITPDMFIFNGRGVDCPADMRRPTRPVAWSARMRRSAGATKTNNAVLGGTTTRGAQA